MDLYDTLTSVFNGLANAISEINKSIHKKQSKLEDSFIDKLKDFLFNSRDICRLKQMLKNTIYEIDGEGNDYFVTIVDSNPPQ